MASELQPPSQFSFDGDLAKNWSTWKKRFDWYLKATKKDNEAEIVQVGILITLLGEEGLRIYETFSFTAPGDEQKIKPVLEKFDLHFQPRKSQTFERYKFLTRHQRQDESCDSFLLDLQSLISSCEYSTQRDSILRDQIVIGVADNKTREKLLFDTDLTLKKAIDMVRACEASTTLADQMNAEAVNRLSIDKSKSKVNQAASQQKSQQSRDQVDNTIKNCHYCGETHLKGKCPAFGKKCDNCGRKNHAAKVCRKPKEKGETLASLEHDVDVETFSISELKCDSVTSQWFKKLDVQGHTTNFKMDTGATCNVLPWKLYNHISKKPLQKGPNVRNYAGQLLRVLGKQTLCVMLKGKRYAVSFVIIKEDEVPILGLPTCKEMNLIQRVDQMEQVNQITPSVSSSANPLNLPSGFECYSDVFRGLGKLPTQHEIRLKNEVTPVIRPARRIPFKIRDQVKKKLDDMEKLQVICKVVEPTEWVSPMVVVQKPGKDVRICLDPLDLNKAVKRQHYPVPTAQELFARIGKAKFFSTLDATSGFLQVPLTEESSYLTTFATPFGRYRFRRLPFGICSAPEVYQQMMEETFGDLDGVEIYFDDFFVWGETLEQHNARLKSVFDRCRKVNMKINRSKSKFLHPELTWIGHVISEQQLKADPKKIEAITSFKTPETKEDLQRLLGMVNYLAKFCPGLSVLTSPLRDLLKREVEWTWDQSHQLILKHLKETITNVPVLRLFNPNDPVTLSVDASPYGLGAVLLQAGQPVEFASRTLTETQTRYAQIEKELLAVQFGLQHFHHYVFGQTVQVETDHKPLIGLVDKPINQCTPRIQRMRMQLQTYDYRLSYTPGREMHLADALSRAPEPTQYSSDLSQQHEEQVNAILSYVIPEQTTVEKYTAATKNDPVLQLVIKLVMTGWPDHKRNCPTPAKPFWPVRQDLTLASGLLLKGEQVVVPTALRPEVLKKIHEGHFGENKSVERAKSAVYWPGYTEQVKDLVSGCNTCQESRNKNPAQLFHPVEVPDYPFQKVGVDLFELNGRHYLLAVDYFSKWPCVVHQKNLSSTAVIEELDKIFSDFGVPEVVISDNGPQFGCKEFRNFAQKLGFVTSTSSPHYPQGNGMAERCIQTVKRTVVKSMQDGRTLQDSLRAIRSTPVGDGLPSPSVLLQARNLRGSLPFLPSALQHRQIKDKAVQQTLQQRQATAAFHQTRANKQASALDLGQRVRVLIEKRWITGKVSQVCKQPNSYVVHTDDNRFFRRNRRAINLDKSPLDSQKALSPTPTSRPNCSSNRQQFNFPTLTFKAATIGLQAQPALPENPVGDAVLSQTVATSAPTSPGQTHQPPLVPAPLLVPAAAVNPTTSESPVATELPTRGPPLPTGDTAGPNTSVTKKRKEYPPPQRSSARIRLLTRTVRSANE